MSDLIILKWTLKSDPSCWQTVFSCYRDISSLQTIAIMLHKSGICGSIKIVSDTATLIEDWSKGYARTSTAVFNEEMKEALGNNEA